jgi:hypothetical protein
VVREYGRVGVNRARKVDFAERRRTWSGFASRRALVTAGCDPPIRSSSGEMADAPPCRAKRARGRPVSPLQAEGRSAEDLIQTIAAQTLARKGD